MTDHTTGSTALRRPPSHLLVLGLGGALVAATATGYVVSRSATAADAAGPVASDPEVTIAAESTDVDSPERAVTVAVPEVKAPSDQLSSDEVAFARNLVADHPSYAGTASVTETAGAQYLSVDVADPNAYDDEHRRLSLMYYDYAAEELLHYVVDLSAPGVESVTSADSIQPAPTELETQTAFDLLLASDVAGEAIVEEFVETTGETTITDEAVDVTAHSFTGGAGVDACETNRCVEVLVQTTDGPFLTTTPYVVDLSTQSVTRVK